MKSLLLLPQPPSLPPPSLPPLTIQTPQYHQPPLNCLIQPTISALPLASIHTSTRTVVKEFDRFAIYGREGVLLLSESGPEVSDYTGSVDNLQVAYYYSSEGKQNFLAVTVGIQLIVLSADDPRLVDVKGMNDQVSDFNSDTNESHGEFASAITGRDETCVISGRVRFFCDAAHLIPRSKGDEVRVYFTISLPELTLVSILPYSSPKTPRQRCDRVNK